MSILDRSESRQGTPVIWLAVHSTEGDGTAKDLRDAAWWTGSSHAIADNVPGDLLTPAEGCVPYDRAAWTIRGGNHRSENIEQVGWAHWTRDEWLAHPDLLDNTARWLADRSKARGIPLVHLSVADVDALKPGVIGHVDYTLATGDGTHTDPGDGYPWDVVIQKARAYAAGNDGGLDVDEATLARIIDERLDAKLDNPKRADKFAGRVVELAENGNAGKPENKRPNSLASISAAVAAIRTKLGA